MRNNITLTYTVTKTRNAEFNYWADTVLMRQSEVTLTLTHEGELRVSASLTPDDWMRCSIHLSQHVDSRWQLEGAPKLRSVLNEIAS